MRIKNALKNIDKGFLNKHKIDLKLLDSKYISSEVNKAVAQNKQTLVFTNIKAGARGIDLAELGEKLDDGKKEGNILITSLGGIPLNDTIQFLARTTKPRTSEQSNISMFMGGKGASLEIPNEDKNKNSNTTLKEIGGAIEENKKDDIIQFKDNQPSLEKIVLAGISCGDLSIKETLNGTLCYKAYKGVQVAKEFMSGNRSDEVELDPNDGIVTPTKQSEIMLMEKGYELESNSGAKIC